MDEFRIDAPVQHEEEEVPAWLTSFGDLMSILLVFFILLMSPQAVLSESQQKSKAKMEEVIGQINEVTKSEKIDSQMQIETNGNTAIIRMKDKLLFPSGSAELTDDSKKILAKILAQLLNLSETHRFKIKGHTDGLPIRTEKFRSNWHLSTERSLVILEEFVKMGFNQKHLSAQGYAEFQPLVSEKNQYGEDLPANRAMNRRVEIHINETKNY